MILLRHLVAQYPHGNAIRVRRDRRLGAIAASRANVVRYAAALVHEVVDPLREAGKSAAIALRPHWPIAHDADPPRTIRHEVGRGRVRLEPGVRGAAPRIATKFVRSNLATVDERLSSKIFTSVGVQVRAALTDHGPISDVLAEALSDNVDLITSIPEKYFDELEQVLSANWRETGSWDDVVEEVEHLGDVTQSRAELIARDQTLKMNAKFNEARQTSLGITKYEWQTVGDDRVREAHQELEGSVQDWDDPPTDSDGNTGHAGDCGVNDRCTGSPIVDLDEEDEETSEDGENEDLEDQ